MALLFAGPEKSSATRVQTVDDSFGEPNRRHVVDGQTAQDGIDEDDPASGTEQPSFPTR